MPISKGTDVVKAKADSNADTLRKLQGLIRVWANATDTARMKWKRDFEMTEGNGKQWLPSDRAKVTQRGMPALEFNQILPQVELVAGIQRGIELDFTAVPRGLEDRRLGEIATASLKAAKDFSRIQRTSNKVFDDATICGLGAWEVLHTLEDPEDLIWGDIVVSRINPLAFIFDPWATQPDWQDGEIMGKGSWLANDTFKDKYPNFHHLANPGDWGSRMSASLGALEELGIGPNLQRELYDTETGRIRVLSLWHKVPTQITLVIDTETGGVREVKNKKEGEKLLFRDLLFIL